MVKLSLVLLLLAGPAAAQDYARCLMRELPSTQNDLSAWAVAAECLRKHPAGFAAVVRGSGRGPLGYADPLACIARESRGTHSQEAARLIAMSCHCLYGAGRGETCA